MSEVRGEVRNACNWACSYHFTTLITKLSAVWRVQLHACGGMHGVYGS